MAKKMSVKASFTGREMEAIAAMLLGSNGINVDPIINDLYPNIEDSIKSLFRCKLALMLNGKLSEFKPFECWRRDSSRKVIKYRCIGESSLMGTRQYETIELWTRPDDNTPWAVVTEDKFNEIGTVRNDSFEANYWPTMEEAIKNW